MDELWEPLVRLAQNVGLLLALLLVRNAVQGALARRSPTLRGVVDGLTFGGAAIASMYAPVEIGPGVILDARVVVVALAGVFGGWLPGALATVLAVAWRIGLGGGGVLAGVGATLVGGAIGLAIHRRWGHARVVERPLALFVLGLVLAVEILLWAPLLPLPAAERFHGFAVPVLVLIPLGTLLLGTLLGQFGRERETVTTLRKQEALLSAVTGALPDRISIFDGDGRFIEVLGGAGDPRRDDLKGQSLSDMTSPEMATRCLEAIRRTLETGRTETVEYVLDRPEGRRWREARTSLLEETDGARYVVWAARDVGVRKETEAELRESERRYRLLFDAASDIVLVLTGGIDEEPLRFQEVNAEGLAVLGYTEREVRGTSPERVLTDEGARELSGHMERLRREGQVFFRIEAVARDGRRLHLEVNAQACDLAGRPAILAIARDVTKRARLEAEIHQAQRLESVGRLAGGIAHDFNNLLTVILNYLRLLGEDAAAGEDWRDDLQAAREAAQRATSLTRQLLAFSRSQALHPEPVDLTAVVRETARMLARFIGEDIELVLEAPEEPLVVEADPGQLEQIIVNLAVNARDAMPRGGRLEVRISSGGPPSVLPEEGLSSDSTGWAHLEVRDSGEGMDEAIRRRVFEPFFTTKGPDRGTGLGLASVHGIVTQSGGSIRVESAPGEGTAFHIHLPLLVDQTTRRVPTAPDRPAVRLDSPHVLLVEDEAEVRNVVSRMLGLAGYDVSVARHAEEALEMARRNPRPIRVLLTDVVLPRMSGPELAERLRDIAPGLQVLYFSGYATDELKEHGLRPDQDAVLRKPFGADVLTSRLAELLAPPSVGARR